MREMQIDGTGFNLDAIDGIPQKDFIKTHQHLYPGLFGKDKDAALANVYKTLKGNKEDAIELAAPLPLSSDQSEKPADAVVD